MSKKMKEYILSNWKSYNVVDSREEMVKLLNILEAHNETLDSLHDVIFNNHEFFCGIYFNSGPKTDRDVVKTLYAYNCFYNDRQQMENEVKEIADDCEMSVEEFLKTEDIRTTSDGLVRVLYY